MLHSDRGQTFFLVTDMQHDPAAGVHEACGGGGEVGHKMCATQQGTSHCHLSPMLVPETEITMTITLQKGCAECLSQMGCHWLTTAVSRDCAIASPRSIID